MFRPLLMVLAFLISLQAEMQRYFIQLGSFQQLNVLEKTINSMPQHLRSHIIVVRSNGWLVPFAYNTTNRAALVAKLPEYKRYFPDAYINNSSYILRHPVVRNYTRGNVVKSKPKSIQPSRIYTVPPPTYYRDQRKQNVAISEEDYTTPYTPPARPIEQVVTIPTPETKVEESTQSHEKPDYFTKKMLSGRHFYLAYKATDKNPNLLVKVKFGNHRVSYQPIIGDMKLNDANYFVDEKKLYMYAEFFTRDGAYSTLEEHHDKYMLVSSWSNGKKLNTLRYYYKLDDAKAYLGEKSSADELSKILEDETEPDW